MEEIKYKEMQMEGLNEKITQMLNGLKKSKRVELDLNDIYQKLREYQIAYDTNKIDLSRMSNDAQTQTYKQSLREHKRHLKALYTEYEWKRSECTKSQLLGDHKAAQSDTTTAEGLMNHGLQVQAASTQSLKHTLQKIEETKKIGQDIIVTLEDNTNQLARIHDKIEDIDSTLARATKTIKRIGRKIATDKYIWVIVFLVFAAIIFIIVWQEIQKRKGNSTGDTQPVLLPS